MVHFRAVCLVLLSSRTCVESISLDFSPGTLTLTSSDDMKRIKYYVREQGQRSEASADVLNCSLLHCGLGSADELGASGAISSHCLVFNDDNVMIAANHKNKTFCQSFLLFGRIFHGSLSK